MWSIDESITSNDNNNKNKNCNMNNKLCLELAQQNPPIIIFTIKVLYTIVYSCHFMKQLLKLLKFYYSTI